MILMSLKKVLGRKSEKMIKELKKFIVGLDFKTIRLMKNIFLSFSIKGLAMFVSLFTMPAYMKFFDNQVALGMWFTAISMLSWILTFDLGIGNGLRNYLVKPIIENDYIEIKKLISSAYISIGLLVIVIIIGGLPIIYNIRWNQVFNITNDIVASQTLIFMVTVLFIGIMINFMLRLINSVYYALQQSALPSFLTLASSIMLLLYIVFSEDKGLENNIKTLSMVNAFCTNLPFLIGTIILFVTKFRNSRPSFRFYKTQYVKKILKIGGAFFWLQIMTMVMFGTNEFIITWLANPEDVVTFQIYNKIFMILCTLFNLALTPVWSAIREAYVKKDFNWITRLYKKLNYLLVMLIPVEILIIICLQPIINMWLGENGITINYTYAIIFAIYNFIYMKVSIDTSIVNGLGKLRIQSIALTVTVIIKIVVTVGIMGIINNWIVIVISNIIALLPYICIEYFDIRNQMLLLKENQENGNRSLSE